MSDTKELWMGIPLEELKANAREYGNGAEFCEPDGRGVARPEDNPYLAVAARELGILLEELQANARLFGNGT